MMRVCAPLLDYKFALDDAIHVLCWNLRIKSDVDRRSILIIKPFDTI